MIKDQERKYDAVDGKIVNRVTGNSIPDEEPIFIFRAKDLLAPSALRHYAEMLPEGTHKEVILERVEDFMNFQETYKDVVKYPDSDPLTLKANQDD